VYLPLVDDTQVLQHLVISFSTIIFSKTWSLTRGFCIYNVLQLRQCTCNVTWSFVQANIVAEKGNTCYIFCLCVCSLRYTACLTHKPYCRLWSLRLVNIFPHYLLKGMIFEKKKQHWT